jgi:hypothetical protein
MTLSNTDVIDLITMPLPGDTCKLVLYVVDSEQPHDEHERYQLLLNKLTNYFSHILSDRFRNEYPDIAPKDVVIRVLCKWPPNDAMLEIKAICEKGSTSSCTPVVFDEYDAFFEQLQNSF